MGQNDDDLLTWGIEDYRTRPTSTVFTEADYAEVDAEFADDAERYDENGELTADAMLDERYSH